MWNTLKRAGQLVIASHPAQRIFTQKGTSRRLDQSSILHGVLPLPERFRLRRGKLSRKNGARQFKALKRHTDVNFRRERERENGGAQEPGGGLDVCNARRLLGKVLVFDGPLPHIDSSFCAFVDTMLNVHDTLAAAVLMQSQTPPATLIDRRLGIVVRLPGIGELDRRGKRW